MKELRQGCQMCIRDRLWDKEKERLKGRSTEALSTNLQLDNIQNGLLNIFRRLEFSDEDVYKRQEYIFDLFRGWD